MYRPTPYGGSLLRLAFVTSAIFALVSMGLSILRGGDAAPARSESSLVRQR